MPFEVTYQIWEPGKAAPALQTHDRSLAMVELHAAQQKDAMTRIAYDIVPVALNKQEKYVWLVYRVLKAIRKYYDERDRVTKEVSNDNLHVSLALEKQLDDWNVRTRHYLTTHPKATPGDQKSFAFFEVVEEWRNCWHNYFSYKKRKDKDSDVEREMKKQCFQMEAEIRKYVKLAIGL